MRISTVWLIAGLMAACAAQPRQRPVYRGPVETGPATLTAARQYLEGRWSLESFEVYQPGGAPIRLQGSGTLVYDNFSNLKIEIRTDPATGDTLRKAGIVIENGQISSEGRVVVDMQNRTMTYVIEGQPSGFAATGPLALNKPRHWVVEGNLLTLTTRDADQKPLSVGRWRKQS